MTGPRVPSRTEYDDLLDNSAASQRTALQQSMYVASKRPAPDRWAKVVDLAQRNKLPTSVVDRNFDTLQATDTQREPDYDQMQAQTPGLSKWVQNPDNATIGKQELAPLGQVDRGAQVVSAPPAMSTWNALHQAWSTGYNDLDAATWQFGALYGHASPEFAAQKVAQANRQAQQLRSATPDYVKSFRNQLATAGDDLNAGLDRMGNVDDDIKHGMVKKALSDFAGGGISTVGALLDHIRIAATNPRGLLYSSAEGVGPSLPGLLAAKAGGEAGAAAGALVGAPTGVGEAVTIPVGSAVGAGAGMFAGFGMTGIAQKITSELQARGYDVTNADDLLRAYSNPALMSQIKSTAEREGLTSAGVNTVFGMFAGRYLEAAKDAGAGVLGRAAASAKDIGVLTGGQVAADVAGQAAGGSKVDPSRALQSALASLPMGMGMEVLAVSRRSGFHADPTQAAIEATHGADEAIGAQTNAQALSEMAEAIKQSPATASVPERLKALVETATGGPDASQVYFLDGEWDHYWQSQNASPAEAAADIMGDDGKAYYEAKATGIPLTIPLGDYMAHVAPTEHFNGLLEYARTKPDGMSLGDAHEYLQSLPATLQDLAKEAAGEGKTAGPRPIAEDVTQQLTAAGRSPAEAKALGALYESTFQNLGARAGVDPLDLYKQYGLSVQQSSSPNAESSVQAPEASLQQGERGRIRISPDRQMSIDLFSSADRSTFIHETGHFYTEVLSDLARAKDSSPQLQNDFATLLHYADADSWESIGQEGHEKIARGFESYIMEGKAPSVELQGVFSRFKTWLTGIYKNLTSLNAPMTDDVRGVFDRLVASDEQIRRAETAGHIEPLFKDPRALGMNEQQADAYGHAVAAAHEAAEQELTQKMMKELQREQSKEWKALRAPIREQVEGEVNQQPDQVAKSIFQRGMMPDGSEPPEGLADIPKLSRTALRAQYGGDETLEALPRMHQAEGGIHPEMAAELFGFTSGDALVDALKAAPECKALIESLTDQRMQAEHGERMSPAQIAEQAQQAVRGDQRVQLLRKELEYLASDHLAAFKGLVRQIAKRIPATDAVRTEAMETVGAAKVGKIQPRLYDLAAARAASEAREALLRGDIDAAFTAKRKELLATELFHAATRAKEGINDGLNEFKTVFRRDEKLSKTRDLDLVNAARSILATFGIGTSDKPASAYLDQMQRYDPETYAEIREMVDVATVAATDYKAMPYADFATLRETVKSLWNLSLRTRQIEIDGEKMDRLDVEQILGTRLTELTKVGHTAGEKEAVTRWERTKMGLLGLRAMGTRVESWVTAMDNGDPNGAFRRFLWNPIKDAATAFRVAKAEELTQYGAIVDRLKGTMVHASIDAPELGYTFKGTNELLGAMLHAGNGYEPGSNGYKLLVGRKWGTLTDDGIVDSSRWKTFVQRMQSEGILTKAHYDYLQSVWDRFEVLKPAAWRAHNEMYGFYPPERTAVSVSTPYGEYRGGYYPAKVDPFMVADAQARADQQTLLGGDTGTMFPAVGKGFTKGRSDVYARPLLLDAGAVPVHLDAVLRFTHLAPHVRDVARVVTSPGLRAQLDAYNPVTQSDMLVPWLKRAASQQIDMPMTGRTGRAIDTFARELRSRSAMQIMAFNGTVLAEQITHFPAILAHPDVQGGKVLDALWRFTRQPTTMAEEINERSPYMATRESAALTEARKTIDKILLDPSITEKVGNFVGQNANVLMRGIQSVMDHVTWSAVYDHVVETTGDEAGAVRRADGVVREVLGSYAAEDMSRFETGNTVQRMFSMFYSFYNAKANFLGSQAVIASRMGLRQGAGRMFSLYFYGFMIPAMLGKSIKSAMGSQPALEDDETGAHAVLRFWWEGQLEMAERFVPFGGTIVDHTLKAFGKHPTGELLSSPAIKMLEDAVHAPGEVYKSIRDHMYSAKATTDFLTLIGMASGLPVRPAAKAVNYIHDANQ